MEIAPPSTFSRSIGMPSLSRQYTTWTAKASFSSQRSIWFIRMPVRSSRRGTAKTGPMPISSGSQAATAKPRKMPSGESPRRSATLASMTTQAEAPSESWLALPAVTWPFSPATGFSEARPSRVVSGRLPSSCASVTGSSRGSPLALSTTSFVVGSGTISWLSRPSRWAAAVRCWLASA